MKAQVIWYQKAKVYDLEIFYRRSGPAAAPTILLLHGFPTSSHMYRNLIPLLNEKYHVIAPDLPGFGFSDAAWGNKDPFFLPAGAEAFKRDLPAATVKFYDTGHFALETHVSEIGAEVLGFLDTLPK
jgi:pimeloyl-ACP methyl ester carboxylesterase